MRLIKTINSNIAVVEDAVGAGDIAGGSPMPLFTSIVSRLTPTQPKVIKYSRHKKPKPTSSNSLKLKEAYYKLTEEQPDIGSTNKDAFDITGTISKLKSLETKEKTDSRDTTTFGLEDDNGGLVRVTIKSDQAADFEKALQSFLSDIDADEELPEIAELLFDLKDRFDIVDVSWPDVEEDEEPNQSIDTVPGDAADVGAEDNGELDLDGELGAPPSGDDQVTSLLASLIDTMKQDAIAKKKQAEVELAKLSMQQSQSRVKQEEQMLDMDAFNKSRKDVDKESKRLAQLAKWKTEADGDEVGDDSAELDQYNSQGSSEEEEEQHNSIPNRTIKQQTKKSVIQGRVHPHDIAQFILNRVK